MTSHRNRIGDTDPPDPNEFSFASDIVELVVLTADNAFLQTLRKAVGESRRVWHVLSSDKVSDLLLAGQVGILVLDVHALHETCAVFVAHIKRQFPDLVVIVAGSQASETLLASLISRGIVYRFIHKPMSPARARLFADAAVKRYEAQRHRTAVAANPPLLPQVQPRWLIAIGCCVLAAVLGTWFMRGSAPNDGALPADDAIAMPVESQLLTRAAAALAANRLTPPATDNALELYSQALAHDASDSAARAGIAEVRERMLARAEDAVLEERLDEAAVAIQAARNAGVENERIALLTARLGRSRSLLKSRPRSTSAAAPADAAAL